MKKQTLSGVLASYLAISLSSFPVLGTYGDFSLEASFAHDLKALNLFSGVSENDFALEQVPTRTEAIVMLLGVLGESDKARSGSWSHPFTDVDSWAEPYIGYAYEQGYTSGISTTKFGTGDATAEMFLTFMLTALGYSAEAGADFTWNDSVDFATNIGIVSEEVDVINFSRGDVVLVSYASLEQNLKGVNTTLAEKLLISGVFSQATYEEIFPNQKSELESTPDEATDVLQEEVETASLVYQDYPEIPDFGAYTSDELGYDGGCLKIYTGKTSSSGISTYVKILSDYGFSESGKYTRWFEDSQLLSTFTTITAYSNQSGCTIYLCELKDTKLSMKMTFLSVDQEIIMPDVSTFVSAKVAEVSAYEDATCVYKNDENNYKYGHTDSIYGNPIYVRKENVDSAANLKTFLNHKYSVLYSPTEELNIDIEVWDTSSSSEGQSFKIMIELSYVSSDWDIITMLNFSSKYGYTHEEKLETLEMVKTMMQEIAVDVVDCFPNGTASGSLSVSGHDYPNLKLDYWYQQDLTWSYNNGKFTWLPELDTFEFYG